MHKYTASAVLFLGVSLCFNEAYSITARDVITYNTPAKKLILEDKELVLFPSEKEIPNLPKALHEGETDLNILSEYYRAVATAYRSWAETKRKEADHAREGLHRLQNQMYWRAMRNDTHQPTSFNQANVRSVHYMKELYIPSTFKAEIAEQKADFYEAMADSCQEINNELKD